MWNSKVHNKIVAGSIGGVLFISGLFMYGGYAFNAITENDIRPNVFSSPRPQRADYFKDIALEGQAVFVYDINSKKVLFEKNSTVPLPLASITKAMTAVVAEEAGIKNNRQLVTIDRTALDTDGESGLVEGEIWDLEKLLSFMLISSSNDGAAAIAQAFNTTEVSFVEMMNKKADELGLNSVSFMNPTGLDSETENNTGGYGSAKDVAKLFEYTLTKYPELLEPTSAHKEQFNSNLFSHEAKNTNTALASVPNNIASKTGFTNKAGGNLALIFDRGLNQPVIVVVLGSTFDGRFTDVENLASSTLKTYNQTQ